MPDNSSWEGVLRGSSRAASTPATGDEIPRRPCEYCGEAVYTGRLSGRPRDDEGPFGTDEPAHTCWGYENGERRDGVPVLPLNPSYPLGQRTYDDEPDIPFEEPPEEGGQLPQTEGWHNSLTLPDGVRWFAYPTNNPYGTLSISTDTQDYPEVVSNLRAWAEENDLVLGIVSARDRWVSDVYVRRPLYFSLAPDGQDIPESAYPWEDDFECLLCGETHLAYTVLCEAGRQTCSVCGFGGAVASTTFVLNGDRLVCSNCHNPCAEEGCETQTVRGRRWCSEHGHSGVCGPCGIEHEVHADEELPFVSGGGYEHVCDVCAESLCTRCERWDGTGLTWVSDYDQDVCRRCAQEALYGGNAEEPDADAVLDADSLVIPTIPGRENIRTCGVEIEGANGTGNADTLATAFYEADLCSFDEVCGYHHGPGEFAHVERDSSVDWEAVIGPLNPADESDVQRLDCAVKTIRSMVHDGVLGLDLRAGLHIHVGAEAVSLDGAYNLSVLFAYLEDVIFRLGAARWPIHRAVANTHYTQPIPKELRKLEFARAHGDEGSRYYALSFNNYFRSMLRNCNCGAVRYDSWEDCTCELGKCTFEFRVFNTTANPRKLHAYLALTQALVAKALQMGKIEGEPSESFPPLDFVRRRFKDMDEAEQDSLRESWSERLEWMFTELPLTDDERESLLYCVRHSELDGIGGDTINELLPQGVAEEVLA